jgi:hypothetical protein
MNRNYGLRINNNELPNVLIIDQCSLNKYLCLPPLPLCAITIIKILCVLCFLVSYLRKVRHPQSCKDRQNAGKISAGIDNRFTKIDNTNAWQHAMLIMSVGSTAQLWKLWKPGKQVEMRQWLQNSALRFSAPSADIVALKKMRAGYRAATGGLCSEARQIAEKSAAGIGHRFIKIDNTNAWQHAMLLMLVGSTA